MFFNMVGLALHIKIPFYVSSSNCATNQKVAESIPDGVI
jgi:hypothetical protein